MQHVWILKAKKCSADSESRPSRAVFPHMKSCVLWLSLTAMNNIKTNMMQKAVFPYSCGN